MKDRVKRWRQGGILELWQEACKSVRKDKAKGRWKKKEADSVTQETLNAERSKRFISEGQYARAAQLIDSLGIAQANKDTLKEMQTKRPQAEHVPNLTPNPNSQPLQLPSSDILKNIKSFKRGSAPGPSGLRPEHLKVAVNLSSPTQSDKALGALTKLVNILLAGHLPSEVAPYFCGARLFGGKKKDGGLRPIAVGEVLRRLTSKAAASAVASKAATHLSPLQLGVGVKNGCESIAHAVRLLQSQFPEKYILQVDVINAFNSGDRLLAFEEVEEHFPELAHWISSCYGIVTNLLFGDFTLFSS